MKKKVYKASVFFAVIGLTLMYFASLYISLEHVEIGEIEKSWSGKNVKISGEVTSFSRSSGHAFFQVNDSTGEIQVVDFDSQLQLREGEDVNVTGRVALYRGQLEIIAK
ncbi:MAG: exodeoxyribonuclease VII large subunit, partial [Candidatus Nanohaloarchaea archaeon]